MIQYYDGAPLICFKTREELDAWQEEEGMFGGEIEYDTETAMYRCADFDPEWHKFSCPAEAAKYYDELAR